MAKRDARRGPQLTDFHLWTEVARTVDPLRPKKLMRLAGGPLPVPPALPPEPAPPLKRERVATPAAPVHHNPAGRTKPGQVIEPRLKRRVARGQIEIDGTIDLHGMRQDEARAALHRFIAARAARGDRTLLVITGKGLKKLEDARTIVDRGVLRAMLPIWLAEPSLAPLIAGWSLSAQAHGGEGAFYVRLRRPT